MCMLDSARAAEMNVREKYEPQISDLEARIEVADSRLYHSYDKHLDKKAKDARRRMQVLREEERQQIDAVWGEYEEVWGRRPK